MAVTSNCPHGLAWSACILCGSARPDVGAGEVSYRDLVSPPEVTTIHVPAKSCAECGELYPWGTRHRCPPRVEVVRG